LASKIVWEENKMLRREIAAIAALALFSSAAAAQDTVKIGLILPMTGSRPRPASRSMRR
jgi:ABC-type sugar transport system substrate-binding protein